MSKGGTSEFQKKQREKELEKVDADLSSELQTWHLHNIDPSNITINGWLLDQWYFALREFLVEKGIIDEQEFEIFAKKRMLKNLREQRPAIVEQIEKMKETPVIARPPIIGPDGNPMH